MKLLRLILPAALVLGIWQTQAAAQTAISLGAATTFGVLGGTTVSSTGATVLNGDLGVSPGAAYLGFPPGVVTGAVHLNDATAIQARADAATAFAILAGETSTSTLTGQDLGAMTLTTGVYTFAATAQLTGILTLDALGDPDARFDFQVGSTLGTAVDSQVLLINGAQAGNVYWQVGSAATFLTSSLFVGNVLVSASITAGSGTTVDGRLLALSGAVTLANNSITVPAAVPEPAATVALAAGLVAFAVGLRRIRRKPGWRAAP